VPKHHELSAAIRFSCAVDNKVFEIPNAGHKKISDTIVTIDPFFEDSKIADFT